MIKKKIDKTWPSSIILNLKDLKKKIKVAYQEKNIKTIILDMRRLKPICEVMSTSTLANVNERGYLNLFKYILINSQTLSFT